MANVVTSLVAQPTAAASCIGRHRVNRSSGGVSTTATATTTPTTSTTAISRRRSNANAKRGTSVRSAHVCRATTSGGDDDDDAPEGLDNPLFNADFKKTFLEAQVRLEAKQAPMKAKVDADVAEIMARVNAERAAAKASEVGLCTLNQVDP
jgi:hypothetical protein